MKILAISHSCITDVNQQLYLALNAMPGAEVKLIVPSSWKSEYTGKIIKPLILPEANFSINHFPITTPGHNSLYFFRNGLSKVVREYRPDIIFLDEEPWSLVARQTVLVSKRYKVPFVIYTKQNIKKHYPLPFRHIEQSSYQTAAAIIALSEEVRTVLHEKGFQGSCPLLPHACDLTLFFPHLSELRGSLGMGKESLVFGYMGRLVPEKGLDTLLSALAHLRRSSPEIDARVLLVGAGPEEKNLKAIVAREGLEENVVFAGVVPHRQAGEYMNCMDVFVLPSRTTPRWKEQFGRVIIEALACEVPVLGSDSGEIPRLIHATGGGLVFKEGNSADLAAKMLQLIKNPDWRHTLGRCGHDAVRSCYTYEAVARQLYEILQTAVSSAPASQLAAGGR